MGRHPRREADERLGGRYDARVLEPSPPAVAEPPYLADDPVAVEPRDGRPVVSPVAGGDVRWAELAADDATLAEWCAARWLAAHRRLEPPPAALPETRRALHVLAERVLSPARQRVAGGKIGLRWTLGGFGTPFFGADVQLRVEGDVLVRQDGERERREGISTLGAAAELAGVELDGADAARPVAVDAATSRWLGDLYGFAVSVLEELRADPPAAGDDPSRVQLWPEHFDMSVEIGDARAGRRATFGLSPGDEAHAEPYVYVAPWAAPAPDPARWNAAGFPGAELPLAGLLAASDQRGRALAFLRERRAALARA